MKKRFYLILIIMFFVSIFVYSQTITVTNPHSGKTWYKGHTYTISWTKSGTMDSNVKITLYKPDHTTLQTIIAKPTANDGSYDWTVPSSIPVGQYIVRVKTMDNAVYEDGDVFTIEDSTNANIVVTNPHSGDTWTKGQTYTIIWTKSGTMDSNVKITLYKPDHTTLQTIIAKPTANDGSYDWTIPDSIPNGQYIVRVKTMDNTVYDDGETFTIIENPVQLPYISVESPHSEDIWYKGQAYTINWTSNLPATAEIKIKLYNGDLTSKILDIVNSTTNDGSYSWTVPTGLNVGNYRIKIQTVSNMVSDESGVFYIKQKGFGGYPPIHIGEKITVTSPKKGDSFAKLNNIEIRWISSNLSSKTRLKVFLLKASNGEKIMDISTISPNDGEMQWKIPLSVPTGEYKVRISTLTGDVYGDSGSFQIIHKIYPNISFLPDLTVSAYVSPLVKMKTASGNKYWLKGDIFVSVHNKGKVKTPKNVVVRVRIFYYDNNQWVSRYQLEFKIQDSIEPGKFSVKVLKDQGFMYDMVSKIVIKVDPENKVHESREDNNTFTKILNTD